MRTASGCTAVLLLNVGTPEAPRTPEVRRYLREFLSDPRVLDVHPLLRWLLLNLVILPLRSARSAKAYARIWTDRGSPLLVHTSSMAAALEKELAPRFRVLVAMRYGKPSVLSAIDEIRRLGAAKLVTFPLYPQYATSTTESAVEEAFRVAAAEHLDLSGPVIGPFYADEGYVRAVAATGAPVVDRVRPEHVLFSFHGLPERHVRRKDRTRSHCLVRDDCCDRIVEANRDCYRAQCFETARLLASSLGLDPGSWSASFQSRLGPSRWIGPHTAEVIRALARRRTQRLAVFCPSFVADCLETLEEIGIRAREAFVAQGGGELVLVPSLNSSPAWIEAAAGLVKGAG